MLLLSQQTVGYGWRPLELGEPIRTTDQWSNPSNASWQVSQWFTSDQKTHLGKVPYRRAVSRRTKVSAMWAAIPKVWGRALDKVTGLWRD